MTDFAFQRFDAFGWIVHRKVLALGDRFEVEAPEEIPVERAGDVAVWTRGRVSVERLGAPGEALPDRVPGDSILRRGRTQAGHFLCTAVEPSEFWCFNRRANRGRLPQLEILYLESDEVRTIGRNALLCTGIAMFGDKLVSGPAALAAGQDLRAIQRSIGFLFLE